MLMVLIESNGCDLARSSAPSAKLLARVKLAACRVSLVALTNADTAIVSATAIIAIDTITVIIAIPRLLFISRVLNEPARARAHIRNLYVGARKKVATPQQFYDQLTRADHPDSQANTERSERTT